MSINVAIEEDASDEWQLLDDADASDSSQKLGHILSSHDLDTAPIFTRTAYRHILKDSTHHTQYGVLGRVLSIHSKSKTIIPSDQRLYINTNAPFSAVVCGVQGSGKSHTVSTMLESMLIPNFPAIGSLSKALCGLVLHYGEGGPGSHPSEAAWLAISMSSLVEAPPVTVYVSHSSLDTMKAVYEPLGSRVKVEPLYFQKSELDAAAFLSMMAVGSSDSAPLYMQVILSILRELGEKYTYKSFIDELEASKRKFNPAQLSGLEQRMSLLNSFLEPSSKGKVKGSKARQSRFAPGQLTVVDLSDPFLDSSSACGLFEIVLRLFMRAEVDTGKVLLVDEAHKYLSSGRGSSGLTNTLLSLVRQQRHLAIRVIISTQEPTIVPPVLLDLCTVMILHRFSSPSWWQHLIQHVSADFTDTNAFDQVVRLQTGQAIVLAPSGLVTFGANDSTSRNTEAGNITPSHSPSPNTVTSFGRQYLVIKTRNRVTADGGSSILVVN